MMKVILGETLEQKRFFDQMPPGREDLLGRRANGPGSPGDRRRRHCRPVA